MPLSSENAVSFLAWWKGGQYLTFYPVELLRQYYREESQEIISDYIHRAVINHSLTVEVGMNSFALPAGAIEARLKFGSQEIQSRICRGS